MKNTSDDIFQQILSTVDNHKDTFMDSEYKDMVELIAKARKQSTKTYCVHVMAPEVGFGVGEIGWKPMIFHMTLTEDEHDALDGVRLVSVQRLMGNSRYSIHEDNVVSLSCALFPVVEINLCECRVSDSEENV